MTWASDTPLFFIIFSVPVFFGDAVFLSLNDLLSWRTQILFALSSFIHFLPNLLFGKSATVLFLSTHRFPAYKSPRLTNTSIVIRQHYEERGTMKATGIVRRVDDLGRIVIPKEIRRTLRIREGDPLLILATFSAAFFLC